MSAIKPSLFIKCECGGCSVMEINFDSITDEHGQFNFALWVNHPGESPLSKKERIRWCEHVTKTGRPWADHTIVSPNDAQRIVDYLNKYLKYGKKSKAKRK